MSSIRENAIAALITIVTNAYAWSTPPSRRLKLWTDVSRDMRPCAFVFEGGTENYTWSNTPNVKRLIEVKLFIYINSSDENPGSPQLNLIMDALDTALAPTGRDMLMGKNMLGGAVQQCRIDGNPMKDPGDIDGDGIMVVPIKIILP